MNFIGEKNIFLALLLVLVLAGIAGGALDYQKKRSASPATNVKNFEDCVKAGNPVLESYPRQCRTSDGRTFVENISNKIPAGDGCVPAGCSSQLCVESNVADTIVTTCEFREEYACYEDAVCERQESGECGWTETEELKSCIEAAHDTEFRVF